MYPMSVLCPLCAQTSFASIDALRNSLIKAANGPLACPICSELFLGLDKLTIHLFSHTNLMTHNNNTTAKVADVPTSATILSTKSPTINEAEAASREENMVFEKKIKRSKNVKTTTKFKEIQQENNCVARVNQTQALDSKEIQQLVDNTDVNHLSACDICEFTFRNEQLRDMHIRLVHQNSPKMTTKRLPSTAATNNSSMKSIIKNEPDFKCHLCAKTFKMKGSLRVHLKVVHMIGINNVNNSSKLDICDRIRHKEVRNNQNLKVNATISTLPLAQQIVVPANNSQQAISVAVMTNSPESKDIQNGTITPLSTHQIGAINTENSVSAIPKTNTAEDLATVADNNSNVLLVYAPQNCEINKECINKTTPDNAKIWECDVCSKSFTTKYFLKKHKRLHTGEMPYSCDICARTFTFQQSYHKHLLYHSDEKPHICAICGRAFKELSTLHNHERIHSGEKPFKCEICGKCFRQRVSFLVHTRIHTGVMPYKCDQCEKNFRYKVSLRTHKCLPCKAPTEATVNCQATATLHKTEAANDPLTENFIKAFLESTNGQSCIQNEQQNSPSSIEIAAITDSSCLEPEKIHPKSVEALLSKTIDDIVVESCNKMGIGSANKAMAIHLSPSPSASNGFDIQNFNDGSSSPLQKLQNMRLQSPKFDMQTNSGNDFVEFSQILFNSSCN